MQFVQSCLTALVAQAQARLEGPGDTLRGDAEFEEMFSGPGDPAGPTLDELCVSLAERFGALLVPLCSS